MQTVVSLSMLRVNIATQVHLGLLTVSQPAPHRPEAVTRGAGCRVWTEGAADWTHLANARTVRGPNELSD